MNSLFKILGRNRRFNIATSLATASKLEASSGNSISKERAFVSSAVVLDKSREFLGFYYSRSFYPSFFVGGCLLSSNADSKYDGENEASEDSFSELESAFASEDVQQSGTKRELENDSSLELELGGDEDASAKALENELEHLGEEKTKRKRANSELFEAIFTSSSTSVKSVLHVWAKEGKDLSESEIYLAIYDLRKRKLYSKALQLFQWLEANKQVEFTEENYFSYVDLISKVHSLQKAEDFVEKIPASFRGEKVYRTLLANCVVKRNVKKAEEVFYKMKRLNLPLSIFAYNQLLLLYSRQEKKKIPSILQLMLKENVKPNLFTYKVLIDAKGSFGDVTGMDQIVETMKGEGIEPDEEVQGVLAKHYIAAGHKEKAKEVMKEMEGEDLETNPWVCPRLLLLYADLGESDQVERIWKVCEQTLRYDNCVAAIRAWGKLKKIEEAEAVFEKLKQKYRLFPMRPFFNLLEVYTENKMLTKGKDLIKHMVDMGLKMNPSTWDALVKLFVGAGEVGKADLILNKVITENQMRPMYDTFMVILDEYSKRGDIHNSEKIFQRMKEVGYTALLRQYEALILAYLNAKSPAYGMKDRMRADNVFPTKRVAENLARFDPFRKTLMSDLLDT
ncbi:PREDICTED: pentatricopeptide repeat-containing protein At3g15590, mitochondrial [Tarenaya hassleriana]|uniref:pentatricopeptide repeat-containing protein At3g15590, mitochondrial n=1 Tax=Tarenaya hassleriana TaxID=28532 RepID=UPI00053C81A2|nr:PREDICTED: pentatricopeptide repeat-containing protein At3g15590, mitochondrial [Tarenaya hassleriana]